MMTYTGASKTFSMANFPEIGISRRFNPGLRLFFPSIGPSYPALGIEGSRINMALKE
jgi:hypothetical protein